MNRRVQIGLLFILGIVFLSINAPLVRVDEALQRKMAASNNPAYRCIRRVIPEQAQVLYFADLEGTIDFQDAGLVLDYYKGQYNLVPTLVGAHDRQTPVNLADYEWLIGFRLNQSAVDHILATYPVKIVKACDENHIVFRRKG